MKVVPDTSPQPERDAVVLTGKPDPPPLPLATPPPARQTIDVFALLLRRQILLRGWDQVFALEPDTALPLLERCASSDRERQALRAFTPLVAAGLLQMLQPNGADPEMLCSSVAHRVMIRPEHVTQIATDLRTTLNQALKPVPSGSIEQLTLAGEARLDDLQENPGYNANLWIGLVVLAGLGLAGASLMAFGMGNRIGGLRTDATTSRTSTATPQTTTPQTTTPRTATPQLAIPRIVLPQPPVPQPQVPQEPAPSAAETIPPDAPELTADAGEALATTPWRSCAALPSSNATGPWGVLAPIASLREARQRCHAAARPYAGGVLLARFEQRTAAVRLASELSAESGQTLQITNLTAP